MTLNNENVAETITTVTIPRVHSLFDLNDLSNIEADTDNETSNEDLEILPPSYNEITGK